MSLGPLCNILVVTKQDTETNAKVMLPAQKRLSASHRMEPTPFSFPAQIGDVWPRTHVCSTEREWLAAGCAA